jgi:hypothetical protein
VKKQYTTVFSKIKKSDLPFLLFLKSNDVNARDFTNTYLEFTTSLTPHNHTHKQVNATLRIPLNVLAFSSPVFTRTTNREPYYTENHHTTTEQAREKRHKMPKQIPMLG